MIEIVSEPRRIDDEFDFCPRNMKQIGNISDTSAIYVEDYVYRFLHSADRKKERQAFVFLGDIYKRDGKKKIFIRGAIELEEISFGGFLPVFSDDMWDSIYRKTSEYFPQKTVVGWAMQSIGPKIDAKELEKISARHFPGEHGNIYLYDAFGEWEQFYEMSQSVREVDGYAVFYEQNIQMSHYLNAYHEKQKMRDVEKRYPENFCVHDEEKYKENVREDREAMARYRAYMKGQKEEYGAGSRVAVSVILIIMALLSGILIQNYAKLSDMQEVVETLAKQKQEENTENENVEDQEVDETVTEAGQSQD